MNDKIKGGIDIIDVLIVIAILYFAWSSKPAVNYFATLSDDLVHLGGASSLFGHLWGFMGGLIVIASVLLIIRGLLDKSEEASGSTVLITLLWPITGWYIGHDFNPSDSPKLAYMGFSLITGIFVTVYSLWLLEFITEKPSK